MIVAVACGGAHAATVKIFSESPYNGTVNASGQITGFYTSNTPGVAVRHAITEFNLGALHSPEGRVVVQAATLSVRATGVSADFENRLGFYGYRGNGVIDASDFGAGDLLSVLGGSIQLSTYTNVDVTAWLRAHSIRVRVGGDQHPPGEAEPSINGSVQPPTTSSSRTASCSNTRPPARELLGRPQPDDHPAAGGRRLGLAGLAILAGQPQDPIEPTATLTP